MGDLSFRSYQESGYVRIPEHPHRIKSSELRTESSGKMPPNASSVAILSEQKKVSGSIRSLCGIFGL